MTEAFWWYLLAGFIVGFTLSTLWEWLYFRSKRVQLENRRIAELESMLRSYVAVEENSAPPTGRSESWATPPFDDPGVFLETEDAVAIAATALSSPPQTLPRSTAPNEGSPKPGVNGYTEAPMQQPAQASEPMPAQARSAEGNVQKAPIAATAGAIAVSRPQASPQAQFVQPNPTTATPPPGAFPTAAAQSVSTRGGVPQSQVVSPAQTLHQFPEGLTSHYDLVEDEQAPAYLSTGASAPAVMRDEGAVRPVETVYASPKPSAIPAEPDDETPAERANIPAVVTTAAVGGALLASEKSRKPEPMLDNGQLAENDRHATAPTPSPGAPAPVTATARADASSAPQSVQNTSPASIVETDAAGVKSAVPTPIRTEPQPSTAAKVAAVVASMHELIDTVDPHHTDIADEGATAPPSANEHPEQGSRASDTSGSTIDTERTIEGAQSAILPDKKAPESSGRGEEIAVQLVRAVARFIRQVRSILSGDGTPAPQLQPLKAGSDLTRIDGLSAHHVERLGVAGIYSCGQLARVSEDELRMLLMAPGAGDMPDYSLWIKQATIYATDDNSMSKS